MSEHAFFSSPLLASWPYGTREEDVEKVNQVVQTKNYFY